VVIANPPFSLEGWGRELWENDPWGRAFAGLPTDSIGDMAWVQPMVASMAEGAGRMAVVLPQGALFRSGVEGQIRQHLLKSDLVEAVIGLAPNLFYGTGLAACVLVLKRQKAQERQGKGLIVDASPASYAAARPRTSWSRNTPLRLTAGFRRSPTWRTGLVWCVWRRLSRRAGPSTSLAMISLHRV
jgi:type I restriction-modification system DNA methylase subunit